ncbi:MAG: S-layer homology domain-containing protein [Clostridia bacterium]|nr:S-layer homology domain-containing protein [Clostridia bacterium]
MINFKRILPNLILFFLFINIMAGKVSAQNKFSDVIENDWYYEYAMDLAEAGIINGFPDKTFRPDETLKSDQFIKMISVALGCEEGNGNSYWASEYILYAKENGMLEKFNGSEYDKPLTRGDMACIVSSALILKDEEIEIDSYGLHDIFGFTPDIYAMDIIAVNNSGIITGYPDGTFGYERNITRAEACAVIYRLIFPEHRPGMQKALRVPLPLLVSDNQTIIESQINGFAGNSNCVYSGERFSSGGRFLQTDFNEKINFHAFETVKLMLDNRVHPVFEMKAFCNKAIIEIDCYPSEAMSGSRDYSMFSVLLYDSPTGYPEKEWGYDSMFMKLEVNRLCENGLIDPETGRPNVLYEYKMRALMRIVFGIETGDVFSEFILDRYIEYAGYEAGLIPAGTDLLSLGGIRLIFFSEGLGRRLCFTFSEE